MTKFKVGDRVKYVGLDPTVRTPSLVGQVGTVTDGRADWFDVEFVNGDAHTGILPVNLEPVVESTSEQVDHPSHYTWLGGIEVIDITEQLSFTLGNVIKYVLRADHKGKPIEDLRKARWYLDREIARREKGETA